MQRRLIIAGNWKMNHTSSTTTQIVNELKTKIADVTELDIVICPTFTALSSAVHACNGSKISVGAQNVHWKSNGAFTGEISVEMLKEIPVEYVIIGHSERRQFFGETDDKVNQKLRAVLDAKLLPIVCVGETLTQRRNGETEDVVADQVRICLSDLANEEVEKTVIAYEPVWAIGTGMTATPEQAQEVHEFIRELIGNQFSSNTAQKVRIQYGGSVKADNVRVLMSQSDIDGALVGGASLNANEFSQLIKNAL